jgi:hypothetical protein
MDISLNWPAIITLTVISFIFGSFWFGPLFGKIWMRIHDFEKKSKKDMEQAMKGMWKLMTAEFVANFFIIIGLACIIPAIPEYSGVRTALMVWVAFILPMCVSNILWGNDPKKYMIPKIALTSGYRLIMCLVAGYVLMVWR